jgi:hypothetical protein
MTDQKLKAITWLSITLITIALWTTVAVLIFGCAICPPGSDPKNIQRWEHKHKFRVERIKEKKGVYVVKFRKKVALQPTFEKRVYECLPDSIKVGKEVLL